MFTARITAVYASPALVGQREVLFVAPGRTAAEANKKAWDMLSTVSRKYGAAFIDYRVEEAK